MFELTNVLTSFADLCASSYDCSPSAIPNEAPWSLLDGLIAEGTFTRNEKQGILAGTIRFKDAMKLSLKFRIETYLVSPHPRRHNPPRCSCSCRISRKLHSCPCSCLHRTNTESIECFELNFDSERKSVKIVDFEFRQIECRKLIVTDLHT